MERGSCRSFYSTGNNNDGVVLTREPKPRLRWTPALHDRFVEAVTLLGGPGKATPKSVLRVMGTKGLTLYHLKSHLQKYRLGKQARKDTPELKDGGEKPGELAMMSCDNINPDVLASTHALPLTAALHYQIQVQAKLREQLEVQQKLQMRIEVQGKYLQTILEKAHSSFSFGTMKAVAPVGEKEETVFRKQEVDGSGSADENNTTVSLDLNVNNGSNYETFSGFRQCDLQLGMQPRT